MANQAKTCGGIVLCGGMSTRMGTPKLSLPFGPEAMLTRVVRLLSQAVQPIVVVAAPGQELPPLPGDVQVARDKREARGPLEGLRAGLAALPPGTERAFVTSCDVPLLVPAFVRRMIELAGEGDCCVAVPYAEGFHHPLAAVYSVDVLPHLERLLAEDRLRATDLFQEVPARVVQAADLRAADPQLGSLRNLNTPSDYQAALAAAGLAQGTKERVT